MRKTKWAAVPCLVASFGCAGGIAAAGTVTVVDGDSFSYVYNGEKTDTEPGSTIQGGQSGHVSNVEGGTVGSALYGGYSYDGSAAGNIVNIEGGTIDSCDVFGGHVADGKGSVENNTVNVTGGTFVGGYPIYGGVSRSTDADAGIVAGNTVNITGGTFPTGMRVFVRGGARFAAGAVTGNIVNIKDVSLIGDICGGYSSVNGNFTLANNIVTLSNISLTGTVYGGYWSGTNGTVATTDNTVSLESIEITGSVYGGSITTDTTGNTLLLGNHVQSDGSVKYSGTGNNIINKVSNTVQNFATVRLAPSLQWSPGATVMSANAFTRCGALDVSAATGLFDATTFGIMTLLSSGTADNFKNLSLTYPDGTKTLNAATPSATIFRRAMSSSKNGVKVDFDAAHTVSVNADGKNTYKKVVYAVEAEPVKQIALGEMVWGTGRDIASEGFVCDGNTTVEADKLTFARPETIAANTSMTLVAANRELAEMAARTKNISYTVSPVPGVTVDAELRGSYASSGGIVAYIAEANAASKLTFGDVEWKTEGALLDHATTLARVSFDGADVDTTNIHFTNVQSLEAHKKMTLISSFGDTVGTITGTKYKVGSTLEGEGRASLVGRDLIFTTGTGTDREPLTPQEQTHNSVMGAEVAMAALSAGNDFVGAATEGLALVSNVGADGVSTYAGMGGGAMRQETGSHIDCHTWNAILAIGHENKKGNASFQYGAFFEYGTGNYTTHNGDERGDGVARYTGGGLLAKYTRADGVYVEGSLRAGGVHDDARNLLRDDNGVPYSYETDAPYFGGHIGFGRENALANGNSLDVYGKYFCNRRNGVSFDAGGRYDLDAVTSQVLRVGARYTMKREKWNFYGGVAYEHELDGKAEGTADGLAIRGADVGGGSFRGELGATVRPDENSPWRMDFNVTGFAGKKRGLSGGVSVALMF